MSFRLHLIIPVRLCVAPLSDVATIVNKFVITAILKMKMGVSQESITVSTRLNVVENTAPAGTRAQPPTMGMSHVDSAQSRAKFSAVTLNAARNATNPVCFVSKTAPGPVRNKARANCHAQCHVICFPVPNNVCWNLAVAISVHLFAERYIQRLDIVRSVPTSQ